MLELLEEHQPELLLRERGVDEREDDALEGEVPRREPWVLPRVRHGEDAHRVEVPPPRIARVLPFVGRRRARVVAVEPDVDVVQVALLRPEHAGERLALDVLLFVRRFRRMDARVEVVGFRAPLRDDGVDVDRRIALRLQRHPHDRGFAGLDVESHPAARLRPFVRGIHGLLVVRGDAAMEGVLHERAVRRVAGAEDARSVCFVVGEEEARIGRQLEHERAECRFREEAGELRSVAVVGEQALVSVRQVNRADGGLDAAVVRPDPGVAEPELRDEMDRRALRPAVVRGDADGDRVRVGLGDLDLDVEVAALVEDAGVEQLELRIARAARAVLRDQLLVRKRALRILVEHALVGMARQRVDVEVALLDVFAMVAFVRHEPEVALFQNRVALVPQGQRPAEDLVAIAEAGDAVLAPSKCFRAREVVGEEAPRVAAPAVVLANGSPGAVGEVGAPLSPAAGFLWCTGETLALALHPPSLAR